MLLWTWVYSTSLCSLFLIKFWIFLPSSTSLRHHFFCSFLCLQWNSIFSSQSDSASVPSVFVLPHRLQYQAFLLSISGLSAPSCLCLLDLFCNVVHVFHLCYLVALFLCGGWKRLKNSPATASIFWEPHSCFFLLLSPNYVLLPACFSSVQFSHSVVSDSLRPHGLQHAGLPCPSPTPGAYANSCPSSQWCHPTISSSVVTFSHL